VNLNNNNNCDVYYYTNRVKVHKKAVLFGDTMSTHFYTAKRIRMGNYELFGALNSRQRRQIRIFAK